MRRAIPFRYGVPAFVTQECVPGNPGDLTRFRVMRNGDDRRVMLLGRPPSDSAIAAAVGTRAALSLGSHYPTVRTADTLITFAASWFGDLPYTADEAAAVWRWVQDRVRVEWSDPAASLLQTPATTGRDLWLRSLDDGDAWPVMSEDWQRVVRGTAGQGRMETLPAPAKRERVRDLWVYDARLAYTALTRELPVGDPEWLEGPVAGNLVRAEPYLQGRALVTWRAPRDWAWPGLLPAKVEGSPDDRETTWPTVSPHPSWVSTVELFHALRAGWDVEVHAVLYWPRTGDPLRSWSTRLRSIVRLSEHWPEASPLMRRMVRNAVRAILLHTIGAIHGAPRAITHRGELSDAPETAARLRMISPDLWAWETMQAPAWPECVHPEWSSTIWSRARARLISSHRGRGGFLAVPADEARCLVAMRTDAIYSTRPLGWEQWDDGQAGRWVLTRLSVPHGSIPWPTNGMELYRHREAGTLVEAEA